VQRQAFWVEPRQPQGHGRVAFLPYVPHTRKVLISKGFKGEPQTVGEHVLKKRLEDGLTRNELARRFEVDEFTVMNWELGRTKEIPARAMPGIIGYLGYNPEPKPKAVGAQLRWKRRGLGWTARDAARMSCVDPATWESWEKQEGWPRYPRFRDLLQQFLFAPPEELQGQVRQARTAARRRS
jgi:transcriptional regulator with XRE-family HTH domain